MALASAAAVSHCCDIRDIESDFGGISVDEVQNGHLRIGPSFIIPGVVVGFLVGIVESSSAHSMYYV
jgi:hypothetical protein